MHRNAHLAKFQRMGAKKHKHTADPLERSQELRRVSDALVEWSNDLCRRSDEVHQRSLDALRRASVDERKASSQATEASPTPDA